MNRSAAAPFRSYAGATRSGRRWAGVSEFLRMAATWRSIARERRALKDLDPHLLKDIGLDREAALAEARRPFWRTDARS